MERVDSITSIIDKHYNNYSHMYNLLTAMEVNEMFTDELRGIYDVRQPKRKKRIEKILDMYYINYNTEYNSRVAEDIDLMLYNEIRGVKNDISREES